MCTTFTASWSAHRRLPTYKIGQDRGGLVLPPLTISPARWPRQLLVDVPGGET